MTEILCEIADVEGALGRPLTDQEEAKFTYYARVVSAYIQSYCDAVTFGVHQDDEITQQADYYGIIDLGGGPISAVTSVTAVDGTELSGWSFDGTGQIYDLDPYQTVIITCDRGIPVPDDVRGAAVDILLGIITLQLSGPVSRKTVGDVTYAFAEGPDIGIQLSSRVLDAYRTTSYTIRLGSPIYRTLRSDDLQTGG